jgi:uncharacterized alkaline shock family protein YloU
MTEVAGGVPEQRVEEQSEIADVTATAPAEAAPTEGSDRVQEFAGDAADPVGEAAHRTAPVSGRIAVQVVERLRTNAELAAERGMTTIANEVVEKIVRIAACTVPGVYELGGDLARVSSAVRERIGLGEADAERGISVHLDGAQAAINIVLCIEYGFVVYSVTEKVRAKVIGAVENLLGLEVTAVDIVVDDVHYEDDGSVGNDEARAVDHQ